MTKKIIGIFHPQVAPKYILNEDFDTEDLATFELTHTEIMAGIRCLPNETAAGSSGWSNKAVTAIVCYADKHE